MFTPENLPNLLKEFEEFKAALLKSNLPSIWPVLDKIQNAVQETHDSLTPSKQKDLLGEMLAKAAQSRKEIEAAMPKLLKQVQKEQQDALNWVQDFDAQIKKTEKDFQEKLKAEEELAASLQNPPPAPPEVPVDPSHGAGLAQELLQALGLLESFKKKGFDDAGSVARMWSDTEAAEHGEGVSASAKSPPPAPPAKTDRPTLKPRSSKPLSRPRRDVKPQETEPTHDESIGRTPLGDE